MDNVSPIKLANWLENESHRVSHWVITCFVFAIAASVLVAVTKSVVFLAVALFAWFFVWNRWKLRQFLRSFLPAPKENEGLWVENAVEALQNPPAWYRYSEGIAALTFFAVFVLITIEVTSTAGIWMRLLYAACWVVLASVIVVRVRNARKRRQEPNTN